MKKFSLSFLFCLLLSPALEAATLDEILGQMDRAGNQLDSMQATIHQKKWTDILSEYDDGEQGLFSFLRKDDEVFLKKAIREPSENILIIREGEVTFYQPAIKQAQRYELGQHGDKAEFLLLGFGSDQEALREAYEIEFQGEEEVNGEKVYKLQLTPRGERVAAFFTRIILWVDAGRWIPVQQKLVEPTRDHLLIRFSDIVLNPKLSESDFKVDLPKDVQIIGS